MNEEQKQTFEVLNGELREVPKDEGLIAANNPELLSPEVQRKYFGFSADEWRKPKSHKGEVPAGFELCRKEITNPFTKEVFVIDELREIPKKTVSERIDELREKVANGTATTAEKNDLKLLI